MNYGHDAIDNYIVTEDRQLHYLEWAEVMVIVISTKHILPEIM